MRFILIAMVGLLLSACVTTSEIPLAANAYRLETNASGVLYVDQAPKQTLRRAAELTLAKGYTHFVLVDADVSTGSRIVGYSTMGPSRTVSHTHHGRKSSWSVSATAYAPMTAIRAPTSNVGATVMMYHAHEPEAATALEAAAILRDMQ